MAPCTVQALLFYPFCRAYTNHPIGFFGFTSKTELTGEEGTTGPGSAPEDTGGIGRGDHRGDLKVVLVDFNILSFIYFKQGGGGSTDDI